MTTTFTTQGIDHLRARQLPGGGTEITFTSTNEGLYHQLYVNGHLADWSESPTQRSFLLPDLPGPCRLAVLAVEREHLQRDFSAVCGDVLAPPPWLFCASVIRGPWVGPGDRVALLGDHTSGQTDPDPLLVRDVWPVWTDRLGWGQDAFGLSAFGYDSAGAPGFAQGAFGAGPFGLDADVIALEAALEEEGLHRLVLRRIRPDGRFAEGPQMNFLSYPPPAPPDRLEAMSYDTESNALTLKVHPSPLPGQ